MWHATGGEAMAKLSGAGVWKLKDDECGDVLPDPDAQKPTPLCVNGKGEPWREPERDDIGVSDGSLNIRMKWVLGFSPCGLHSSAYWADRGLLSWIARSSRW
jgi:hypothetical protein